MKAAIFHEYGGPEVIQIEDIPEPEPGPGQVLVEVKAVGLNHLDLFVRQGLPGIRSVMPHIGGSDFTGVVKALGPGAEGFVIGQRVIDYPLESFSGVPYYLCDDPPPGVFEIIGEQSNGGCCEAIAVNAPSLQPLPEGLSFEEGAACPIAFITAWRMLTERAELRPGETLLVQGAGSGVGTAAIQIGKLLGARVIASTSTPEKIEGARALGADEVINYREESISGRVREITGKAGANVVFEHVGEATWEESIKSAAYHGRIVTCGATTGFEGKTHLALLFSKQLSILGSTMGSLACFKRVLRFLGEGKLKPVIDRVMPLDECRRAHEILETGEQFGKIVLKVAD
ncbi:MAG TPA: alcohol dehydrogenase [Nitrospinae bacterium]|nr:alcohol dehydrogenase [Nitrospinota bacterium]